MRTLARLGAQARLAELVVEMDALLRAFPELRRRAGVPLVKRSGQAPAAAAPEGARRRPRMSAAARRAVSLRMKKYWAARRKSKDAKPKEA